MKESEFECRLCRNKTSYEFVPKKENRLELAEVARRIENAGIGIEAETPFLLMLSVKGRKVSLFRNARFLVKSTTEEKAAREIAEALLPLL